jgi:acyl carrier protein
MLSCEEATTVNAVELEDTLRAVVARRLQISPETLSGGTDLDSLGIDDETALAVLVDVEDILDIRFPDDFFDGVHTYGDLSTAIRVAVGV